MSSALSTNTIPAADTPAPKPLLRFWCICGQQCALGRRSAKGYSRQ
jgi:hypothetical protein